MSLFFRVNPPYQWLQFEGGRVEEFGEVAALTDLPKPKSGESIGVLDAEMSSFHHVEVPAKNMKQLTAAIPFALEETLTEDIDDLHFTTLDWRSGESADVVVVAKSVVKGVIDEALEAGVYMDKLLPELQLIPIHEVANATLISSVQNGETRYLMRGKNMQPVVIDEDFLDMYIQGIKPEDGGLGVNDEGLLSHIKTNFPDIDAKHWSIGSSINTWMQHSVEPTGNLLHSEYQGVASSKSSNKSLSWVAALLVTAFLIKCLFDGYEYVSLWKENRWLDTRMAEVIQETFPNVTKVVPGKERFIMQQQMRAFSNQGGSDEFQEMLAVVAFASTKMQFVIDDALFRSGSLDLTCSLKDFSQVDQLTALLGSKGIDARLTSSSAESGEVSARYKLKRKS